jgi:hypothetical protein
MALAVGLLGAGGADEFSIANHAKPKAGARFIRDADVDNHRPSRPVMRTATGLNPNQAGRQIFKVIQ